MLKSEATLMMVAPVCSMLPHRMSVNTQSTTLALCQVVIVVDSCVVDIVIVGVVGCVIPFIVLYYG